MTSPVSGTNTTSIMMQTSFRRELQGELLEIEKLLKQHGGSDEKTLEIINWHRLFKVDLKKGDAEVALQKFIPLLQEILVDPISHAPLDEESYLGSDGITYGHRTLFLYKHGAPQNLKERSPLDPNNPAFFSVNPHNVVRELVLWLKRHNALLRSVEHDRLYEQLMRQIHAPRPVGNREERLRRIQERQRAVELERQRELSELQDRIRQEVSEEVQRAFQPIQERILEVGADQTARIEAIAAQDQERIAIVQNNLGNQNSIQQAEAFQEQLNQVQNLVENTLEAQIEALERGIKELNSNNQAIRSQIDGLEDQCEKVHEQIHETKKAIKKAKKAKTKQVFIAVACVGACVFATWAVMGLAAAYGASAAITPVNQGAILAVGIAI